MRMADVVVSRRGRPPLPPQPWLVRDASIERTFATTDIPLIFDTSRQAIEKDYARARKHKALALSARGIYSHYWSQGQRRGGSA
jgi:hypothetical protein